jgi:hypothetical protein
MASTNDLLLHEAISHQVDMAHYSNGEIYRLIALLNKVDADLFAQLTIALEQMPEGSFSTDRLESLLISVRSLNKRAYDEMELQLTADMRALTAYEAGYQYQLFASVIPRGIIGQVGIATVNVQQVYAAAMARPFQGRLLKEWAQSLEAGRMLRIRDSIRMGYVEGQTISEIIKRIRGTRAKDYEDGIIEIDRRNAESVVRTAISHTAAYARDQFNKANGDLVKSVQWTSTLDGRTTEICMLRDGKQYTNDTHKPIGHSLPWLGGPGKAHWNCRSMDVPILKSFKDLGLNIDDLPPKARASMDGQVPADMTYADWLSKQIAARQDEILGPTRGKLLRDGGLTLDRFANNKGKWYTLDELAKKDAAAFAKAGL